jgi:divinyl chlorophyllide a 8-vinyl-reductase
MNSAGGSVLLAGATGYIGRAVAAELSGRGYRVLATVRDRRAAQGLGELAGCDLQEAEATDAASLGHALEGCKANAVISCIASRNGVPEDAWRVDCQANRHLLDWAENSGAKHFVLLSAICVQRPKLEFQRAKLTFEADLQSSRMDYSIVRPTAFFKSLSGQVDRVRRGKPFLVFGDGTQTACKPIGERDLARYLVDCLDRGDRRNRILPIGGPGPAVTPREQGELLFELSGRRPRFRQVPVGLFDIAAAVLAPLGRLSPRWAAKAELARIGRYYATESMLLWDPRRGRYDAGLTPSTGTRTLRDHYRQLLDKPHATDDRGAHRLF